MTSVPNSPDPYLPIYLATTGAKQESGPNGWQLTTGQTYYVPVGGDASSVQSVQVDWDAAIIMTITVEDSNHPTADVFSTSTREWTLENPSTAIIGVVGGTPSAATVTVAGGTAGSCMYHLGNTGALRNRLKIVVGGTGGFANAKGHGKGT